MLDKSKVRLDFPTMRLWDLIAFCMLISLMLFANALFLASPITKIAYDALIKDFQTKYIAALRGNDPVKNQERNAAYDLLMLATRQLAFFVDMTCMGDRFKIALSGFNVNSPGSYTGKNIFSVIQGIISGQAILDWGSDDNARTYTIRYFINEEGSKEKYLYENAGKIGCTINGLTKFKEYGFALCSVYSTGDGRYGDPIFLTVV